MKKILFLALILSASFAKAQNITAPATSATVLIDNGGTLGKTTLSAIGTVLGVSAGTVTSVAATVPTGLSVAGSPITAAGTLAITNNMAAGYVSSAGVGGALTSSTTIPTTALSGTVTNAQLANNTIGHTVGTTGTDVNVSAATTALGASFQINVPDAGVGVRGVVNTIAQTWEGNKTFNGLTTHTGGSVQTAKLVNTATTVTAATSLVEATSNNKIIADATGAAFTITLPTTPSVGLIYTISKKNVTTNSVTIAAGAGTTVNGASSTIIYTGGIWYKFEFDGANWEVK